jgi:hypothetical protein
MRVMSRLAPTAPRARPASSSTGVALKLSQVRAPSGNTHSTSSLRVATPSRAARRIGIAMPSVHPPVMRTSRMRPRSCSSPGGESSAVLSAPTCRDASAFPHMFSQSGSSASQTPAGTVFMTVFNSCTRAL